jgi:hypothetical protein
MGLDGKDDAEIARLEDLMVTKLREFGGFSGNMSLQRELQWDESLYWPVRNRLYDRGLVTLGRGRGGSVTLVERATTKPVGEAAQPPTPTPLAAESALYEPIAAVLRRDWIKDYRLRQSLVEITAAQGRRHTGGTWTRPDLVVAGLRIFPHLPGKYFDLFTFEVKPYWAIDVTAVYEALAHRRAATQSYVWFHVPTDKAAELTNLVEAVVSEAKRFGIGLVVATDPGSYETWDFRVEATRAEPDPEVLNDFISVQLSPSAKDEIVAWVR